MPPLSLCEDLMRPRHSIFTNQSINTRYGHIKLDQYGYITNVDELPVPAEELLKIPDVIDGDLYPHPKAPKTEPKAPPATTQTKTPETKTPATPTKPAPPPGPSDAEYLAVIKELMAVEGAKVNGEGFIDMEFLLAELKKRRMPAITGNRRKDIWNAHLASERAAQLAGNESTPGAAVATGGVQEQGK